MSLPDNLREALERYVRHGIPPGSCLEAALSNDFVGFFSRADGTSIDHAFDLAVWIYNRLPSVCYGSRRVYRAWIAMHAADQAGDPAAITAANHELATAFRESRATL